MVTTDEVWFRYLDYSGQTKAVRVASVRFWPDIQETIFPLSRCRKASAALCAAAAGVMTGMRMAAGWVNTAAPAAGNTYRYLRKRTDIWLSTSERGCGRYGREVYRAFRSKGNHRWDTCVFVNESGLTLPCSGTRSAKRLSRMAKRSGATSLMMKSWWPRRTRAVLPRQNSHNWPTQRS